PSCAAHKAGRAAELPLKKPKAKKPTRRGVAFYVERSDGAVLLRRRPDKGLLGGMLGVPTTPWEERAASNPSAHAPLDAKWEPTKPVMHTFTHFHLELEVWRAEVGPKAAKSLDGEWTADPLEAGLPTVMQKAVKAGMRV
ncbi:MAG: NUDIX domain-containing protein, partial [Pseudomonadota bacterium]